MDKKLRLAVCVIMVLIFSAVTLTVYAYDHEKGKEHSWDFKNKLNKKVCMILKHQDELGLSDDQIKAINDLDIKAKKDIIRKEAEIEIICLDIKAGMSEDPIDTNAVNKLIDKKYELKKEMAKSFVDGCGTLKNTLTKEQKEKMKELKKGMRQKPTAEGKMKCPMMQEKMQGNM